MGQKQKAPGIDYSSNNMAMERVQTLCNKLNEQVRNNASPDQLLLTVQMLQSELMHLRSAMPAGPKSLASVNIPVVNERQQESPIPATEPAPATPAPEPEEKIIEVLKVDEAEVEAELEEIKRNAENRNKISAQNKPRLLFDPIEDTPTLTHQQPTEPPARQKEIHETIDTGNQHSLNDRLKQEKLELTDSLKDVPIKDLKKGIGVNDRFLFIRELFRGDETMYERSIKTINSFSIYPEAEYWIKRELKLKLAWDDRNEVVRQFDQLVRRRFS